MKKRFATIIPGIAVIALATLAYHVYSTKPDYINAAEERVSSYLTSDYGQVSCQSQKIKEEIWQINCLNLTKGARFEFTVFPAEHAPYVVARSFYIEAVNDNAKQSAEKGLMQYLQIHIEGPVSPS